MVGKILLVSLLSLYSFGDALDDKIRSFISGSDFSTNKKKIDFIFKDIDRNAKINSLMVLERLKNGGFLRLDMSVPGEVRVRFKLDFSSFFAIKSVSDSLSAIGYNYFVISESSNDKNGFFLEVAIPTGYNPDPLLLGEEFQKRGIRVDDISKNGNVWSYSLITENPKLPDAVYVQNGEEKSVSRLFDNYWIESEGAKMLSLTSQSGNSWYPYVVFYDKYLNILSIYEKDSRSSEESIEIPSGTRFIKVSDLYGFYNIKNGFTITVN